MYIIILIITKVKLIKIELTINPFFPNLLPIPACPIKPDPSGCIEVGARTFRHGWCYTPRIKGDLMMTDSSMRPNPLDITCIISSPPYVFDKNLA
jgi:hypothetical protein